MEISAQLKAQTALTRQNNSGNHRIWDSVGLTAGMDLSLTVQPADSHYICDLSGPSTNQLIN